MFVSAHGGLHADTLICSYSEFFVFSLCTVFGTTNCETSGTPEFSKSFWEQFLFMFILFLLYVYAAKPYAGKPCLEAGSHAEGMRLCGECADIFGVFQAAYMGSKFSKTAEVCFSEFRMAESPKSVVVEEGVPVPTGTASGSAAPMPGSADQMLEAGSNAMPEAPNTTTVEGLPVVPASESDGDC